MEPNVKEPATPRPLRDECSIRFFDTGGHHNCTEQWYGYRCTPLASNKQLVGDGIGHRQVIDCKHWCASLNAKSGKYLRIVWIHIFNSDIESTATIAKHLDHRRSPTITDDHRRGGRASSRRASACRASRSLRHWAMAWSISMRNLAISSEYRPIRSGLFGMDSPYSTSGKSGTLLIDNRPRALHTALCTKCEGLLILGFFACLGIWIYVNIYIYYLRYINLSIYM